ncbi:hypothetical protein IWQ62_005460 [Dispira parvispora]|uniref:Uncharacterized protein n=1 Tax=Dispira parvispora TaxID=1520584 RepID=A0A9W8E106_9FUNG|nr:hypothetical protein IWQ62_005460 [Dispira parvispora]
MKTATIATLCLSALAVVAAELTEDQISEMGKCLQKTICQTDEEKCANECFNGISSDKVDDFYKCSSGCPTLDDNTDPAKIKVYANCLNDCAVEVGAGHGNGTSSNKTSSNSTSKDNAAGAGASVSTAVTLGMSAAMTLAYLGLNHF